MLLTARPLSLPSAALARVGQASGRLLRSAAALIVLVALLAPVVHAQQAAGKVTLTGVVKDVSTGAPVPGVTVKVAGLATQVISNDAGVYTIPNLPMGQTITIDASRVGYGPAHVENVVLDKATVTKDLEVNPSVMALEAVTSSATSDPTTGVKMPMAVTKLDASQMPVPNFANGALSIAGKVAGVTITRTSGRPGDSSIVQLGAILSPFGNNAPLYVVDGVPLVNTTNTSSDFGGLDIESVEIIRGAAAASLYGSRASGGVISITTKRGKDVAVGSSQIELFQTYGDEDVSGNTPARRKANPYKENEYGQWVSNVGTTLDLLTQARQFESIPFQDNLYPVNYDQVHQALIPNEEMTSRVSITQTTATTNLQISVARNREPGTVRYNLGQTTNNIRFYVSHQLRDNLQLDANVSHNRSNNHNTSPSTGFNTLFFDEPYVNLLAPNTDKRLPDFPYATFPDTNNATSSGINPIFAEYRYSNHDLRERNTVSTNLQYRPFNWLTISGDFGYDKSDNGSDDYTAPGFPTGPPTTTAVGSGQVAYYNDQTDGFNWDASGQVLRDFGRLTTTFTLRAHEERQSELKFAGTGTPIGLGSETLTGASSLVVSSSDQESRITSIVGDLKGDYGGKYIGDIALNHEGNSLFGPDQRWNNFYRAAGSWLLSEEAWYPGFLSKLTLAKLRASYGVSGGAPKFGAQFEEVTVSSSVGFQRQTLGNPDLQAEKRYDIEVGGDFIWNSKISFQGTYRRSTLKGAIIPGVAPAVSGYSSYTANLGTTRAETYEGTVQGTVVSTKIANRSFRWSTNLVADHSLSTIVKLGKPCYGINGYHPVCDGDPETALWGLSLMTSYSQLTGSYAKYRDWWEIDDSGFLVPVGPGNHYWEGVSKGLWGTALTFELGNPSGTTEFKANWGVPQIQRDDSVGGASVRTWHKLGDSQQLFNYGFNNDFTYGNFSAHFQIAGAVGGDIWNNYIYTSFGNLANPVIDQYMKPDSLKKPIYYYTSSQVTPPGGGDTFSSQQINNTGYGYSNDVMQKNWAKLKEAQIGYAMNARQYKFLTKMGVSRLNLQVTGSNLFSYYPHYTGEDAEGSISTRGDGYFRYDDARYPETRQYRGVITVTF